LRACVTRKAGVDEVCEPLVLPGTPRLRTFNTRCALSVRRRSCGTTSVVEFLDHPSVLSESGKSGITDKIYVYQKKERTLPRAG
jgi:hypothetical protein